MKSFVTKATEKRSSITMAEGVMMKRRINWELAKPIRGKTKVIPNWLLPFLFLHHSNVGSCRSWYRAQAWTGKIAFPEDPGLVRQHPLSPGILIW